ncbi:MAG: acetylglutamate kinase [Elusimicrobiota bacterium]
MNKITVIKFGGSISGNESVRKAFLKNLVALSRKTAVVLVHGGGPEINKWLEKAGIKSKFVKGLRYTDGPALEIVEMVLIGKVNKGLVGELNRHGVKAVGLSGKDGGMILCKRIASLGFVGEPVSVRVGLIYELLKKRFLPVVSSLGFDGTGHTLNVNADSAAMGVACALKAGKLILLTDVEGVLDKDGKMIPKIKISAAGKLISKGVISGGMVPKIKACVKAVKSGVKEVWIAHGTADFSRLRGTVIKK